MKYFAFLIIGILLLGLVVGCSDNSDQNTEPVDQNLDSQGSDVGADQTAEAVTDDMVDPEEEVEIGDVI